MDKLNTIQSFQKIFGEAPEVLSWAPGRLEVLGNHTDYNEGFVLSAAVNYGTEIALRPIKGSNCRVISAQIDNGIREFDSSNLKDMNLKGDWLQYLVGTLQGFLNHTNLTIGFEAVIHSNMPLSSGMSSSASLEMSFLNALCESTHQNLDLLDKAQIGQKCENEVVGANTGLLDQLSSLVGRNHHILLSEYRDLNLSYVPFPDHLTVLVVNSGIKHDLSQDYNERRAQCEAATNYFSKLDSKIKSLRDVDFSLLTQHKSNLSHNVFSRALHIVGENSRVQQARTLLERNEIKSFGKLLYESHESSKENFENSCPELDHLIEFAKSSKSCLGARLSGGGFGGISLHLVEKQNEISYLNELKEVYFQSIGNELEIYCCEVSEGAKSTRLI